MPTPLIVVTVTARRMSDLRQARDANRLGDLVELRLDEVEDLDVAGALEGRDRPVIVTCRPVWEGGSFQGSEEERHRILHEAIACGADYVDLEWRAGFTDLIAQRGRSGIVLSMHDFDGVPHDLDRIAWAMMATGADRIKIAVQTRRLTDLLPLLDLRAMDREGRLITIGMGPAGLPSRVLPSRFGSCWTYAGDRSEVGQIDAGAMINEFRVNRLTPDTAIYGVTGKPLAHSLSPAMHNAAFRALGIDAVYLPLEAADADDFLTFAAALWVRGASITAPYKRDLYERVDEADPVSRRVGAINTLRRDGTRWIGANTDVPGFLAPLDGRLRLRDARVAVIGTGGAARAVAVALGSVRARVTIYGRDKQRADETARTIGAEARSLPLEPGPWDLIVNTTPVGMSPNVGDSPLEGATLDGALVYDLIYNPSQTRLLADAERAGCQTLNGLEMLVAQAQLQFHWWTGHRPTAGTLRQAALQRLTGMASPEGGSDEQP